MDFIENRPFFYALWLNEERREKPSRWAPVCFCMFSLSSFLANPSNEDHAVVERGGVSEMGISLFFAPTPIKYGQC